MQCLIWSYLGADLKKAVEQKALANSLCANVLEHNDKLTSELQLLQSALPVTATQTTQTTQTGTFEDWWLLTSDEKQEKWRRMERCINTTRLSQLKGRLRVGQLNTTRRRLKWVLTIAERICADLSESHERQ